MIAKKPFCLLFMLCVASSFATQRAQAADVPTPDFSGIWRLDDQQSDSPATIDARLRAERKREQPPEQPASTSSTAAPGTGQGSGQHSGGHGMGGGHSHGGRGHNKSDTNTDSDKPAADEPPPLLDEDALLNVQQDAKDMQVSLGDADRLGVRLDGSTRQSLSGKAMVQMQRTADGMLVSMQFDGGVRLQQDWVKSADGRHLTLTERWTTPAVQQPIVFTRSYDRLDI